MDLGGDQDASDNIVHLVLSKVEENMGLIIEGAEGLSLLIVPKVLPDGSRNDVTVAGLNHKMGYRGTSNCLLNFGEGVGATGWMVGAPGQGLRQMFMMMNEAGALRRDDARCGGGRARRSRAPRARRGSTRRGSPPCRRPRPAGQLRSGELDPR